MSLDTQIQAAAEVFVSSILDAIRSADLGDIAAVATGARAPAKARGSAKTSRHAGLVTSSNARGLNAAAPGKVTKTGRLARRSAETIAVELDRIVALLKKNPDGMRSEHIRSDLGMIAKEMPRLLSEGLKTKKLKAKGQKRATVYSVK